MSTSVDRRGLAATAGSPAHRTRLAPLGGAAGFNLVELLMAMALSTIIFMAVTMLFTYQAASMNVQNEIGQMDREAAFALDHLRRDFIPLGSHTTPNSDVDPLVCPKPALPIRVLSLDRADGFVYLPAVNPGIKTLAITLFGSLDIRDRYRTVSVSGDTVTLVDDGGLPASQEAFDEAFSSNRFLRIGKADGTMWFQQIKSADYGAHTVTVDATIPRIEGAQRCGYQGFGQGLWVDVQNYVRYRIIADARPGAPVGGDGNPSRGLLVRESIATDGTTVFKQLVLAENAVELGLNDLLFDLDPESDVIKLQLYPQSTHNTVATVAGAGLLGSQAGAHPEQLRSLTVKISLRADSHDRRRVHLPRKSPAAPLLTYKLDTEAEGSCPAVSMATRIALPTMVSRNL